VPLQVVTTVNVPSKQPCSTSTTDSKPDSIINRKRVIQSPEKVTSLESFHDVLTTANSLKRSMVKPMTARPQRFAVMRNNKTNQLLKFNLFDDSEIGLNIRFVQDH
jgi:hypothetical protein